MRIHTSRRLTGLMLSLLLAPGTAGALRAAGNEPTEGTIRDSVVVTASLSPETEGTTNRELIVLEGLELRTLPVHNLADLLSLLSVVDFQPKIAGGLYGDVHLRGSNYSGVLVCVDGIRWNDPQTGHFNMELPIPFDLVERVEILTGSQSIFYGSDAVGGVINIITRSDKRQEVRAAYRQGSFDTRGGSVYASVSAGRLVSRLYAGTDRSDGHIPNRDSRVRQLVSSNTLTHALGRTQLTYAFLDNAFGASGFYGTYPSFEETRTHGLQSVTDLDRGALKDHPVRVSLSWRRHMDDYILYRDRPTVYRNRHITDTLLLRGTAQLYHREGTTLSAVGEVSGSRIQSNRLGEHDFTRSAAAAEWLQDLAPGLTFQGSLRMEHYTDFGTALCPGAGLSWMARKDLKLRASYGRAFRAPSFTELYYVSPTDRGDPALGPEKADSFETGADWYASGRATFSVTVFRRHDRNLIDWIRRTPKGQWTATNIGTADVTGGSLLADLRPHDGVRLKLGYSCNDIAPETQDFESKYVLDYVRHHLSALLDWDMGRRTSLSLAVHHKFRPETRDSYTPASARLTHRLGDFEFYVQGDNLFNVAYEEQKGITMPGRGVLFGVRFGHLFE